MWGLSFGVDAECGAGAESGVVEEAESRIRPRTEPIECRVTALPEIKSVRSILSDSW